MEPESDSPHPSAPSGYVQIPQALADRLFSCYYGTGPRKGQSAASLATELGTAPPAAISQPEGELAAPKQVLHTDLMPRGFVPRGFAARPAPVKEQTHAQ
jgi:hypothetical protein